MNDQLGPFMYEKDSVQLPDADVISDPENGSRVLGTPVIRSQTLHIKL